jgi:hypothetical protein
MYPRQRKPTRGLEPRTPSLRVAPSSPFLALARHFRAQNMSRDHLRFAEFGTYLGTRPAAEAGSEASRCSAHPHPQDEPHLQGVPIELGLSHSRPKFFAIYLGHVDWTPY